MSKSQIIVTSRYLKSGGKKSETKRKNYTKYIATREGAEIRSQNKNRSDFASTEKQKNLLNELINDFPEAKKYLEYEDYTSNPILENASELISTIVERNADVIGNRQNFVGYMAMRPGAEKRGAHGLFNGSDEPITLNQVAEEMCGVMLFHSDVRTLCDWGMIIPNAGGSLSCGIFRTLQMLRKYRCAI